MATVLVVGTLAVDYIGSYSGSFHALQDADKLNISLTLDELESSYGGCAINIAVGLRKLGHRVLPFALTGEKLDAGYRAHLSTIGVSLDGLISLPDFRLSSQCFIVTDADGNQFTSFYPGPSRSDQYSNLLDQFIQQHAHAIDCVVLAPDIGINTASAIKICQRYNLPFLSDPGQCLNDFTDAQTQYLVDQSSVLCVNRHEYELLQNRVRNSDSVPVLVKTMGENGVEVIQASKSQQVAAVLPERTVDPTGCGDAFRAGLVHGRLLGYMWIDACKVATTLASIAIEHHGTQTYAIDELSNRVQRHWGLEIQSAPLSGSDLFVAD